MTWADLHPNYIRQNLFNVLTDQTHMIALWKMRVRVLFGSKAITLRFEIHYEIQRTV